MQIIKNRDIKDLNKFNDEAKALNSKITIVLKKDTDELIIRLSDALTSEEETALDDLVANFEDVDIDQKIPKIIGMAKGSVGHFHAINYTTGLNQALIPLRTIVKGEVTRVTWYKSLNELMQPVDPVLRTDIAYTRDTSGFALSRVTTRTYFNLDDSENEEVKTTVKYYFVNQADMIDEGIRRRSLLVKNLQIPTMQAMTAVLVPQGYSETAALLLGRHFMDDYRAMFDNFEQNSSTITEPSDPNYGRKTVVVALENEQNAEYVKFLDAAPAVANTPFDGTITIRQYLIGEFSI